MNKTDMQDIQASDALTDTEIITRVLAGEKELYALIVRRHNQRLYRIGMSIINDDTEIEDIMQVTYILAWENLGKFAFKSSFSTWLTRILINESLLRLKKRERFLHVKVDFLENITPMQQTTPVTNLLNTELKSILEDAIRRLPEKYRVVFVMREIEGMNVAETKECLDISEVNVKVRLNRAKSLLRASLSEYYSKDNILHFHLSRCDRIVDAVMKKIGEGDSRII